jgi:hypothetical protein
MRDVAYLLSTAPTVENRRKWEHELLKGYLADFERFGGPHIPEDEWMLEFRVQLWTSLGPQRATVRHGPDL